MSEQAKKNMAVWDKVSKTDPSGTRPITDGFLKGKTAIASLLPVKMATETFGPVGIGWGYEILEERFDAGEHVYTKPKEGSGIEPLLLGIEQLHTMKVRVWAKWEGEMMEAVHFGHTSRMYRSKWGISVDDEYAKKSLSDAVKKALSMFGVNADIYLGEFEDIDYVNMLREEMEIDKADNKEAKRAELDAEYEEWKTTNARLMQDSSQISELDGLYTSAVRKAGRRKDDEYIKTANAIWKERALHFISTAPTYAKLEYAYKAANAKAKGWRDSDWKKKMSDLVIQRKAELEKEATEAA